MSVHELNPTKLRPWVHTGDETNAVNRPSPLSSVIGDDPLDAKILTAIANLNNHILEGTSTKELNRSENPGDWNVILTATG